MEARILIKNLNAKRAGQTDSFAAAQSRELSIGRDPSCDVKFDPNDDLVSRRHAKITQSGAEAPEFTIADLGSRNGTFVNKQRIFGPVKLGCGDVVQLGPGGPEFEFDMDPRPAGMVKATRLADSPAVSPTVSVAATRDAGGTAAAPPMPPAGTVGKATVERMIKETKSQSRKMMYVVVGGLLIVVAAVAAWLYMARPKPTTVDVGRITDDVSKRLSPTGQTPAAIAAAATDSTVLIEVGWKLIDIDSGKQLSHVTIPNRVQSKDKKEVSERVPGAGEVLPVFIVLGDKIEPLLSTDDGGGRNQSIGGMHSGSGFVVSNDGFILTNRHVAAAWHSVYHFPARAGIALVLDGRGAVTKAIPIPGNQFPQWIPAQAKLVTTNSQGLESLREIPTVPKGKALEGRNDYLDVTFPKNRIRIPAKLSRISDRIDVTMIKIDLPQTLKKVELNDNYDTIKVGDPIVSLGYPGVSPPVLGVVASRDPLNSQNAVKEIPDPTLASGNVGRILRGQVGLTEATVFGGDLYQLTINSTGAGNSGGPVFDDHGRVIGIFTLGRTTDVTISFAVPIRYGIELMGVNRAVK